MTVGIYEIDRGYAIWIWLCQKHLDARRKDGWVVKTRKKPKHDLACDDCRRESAS